MGDDRNEKTNPRLSHRSHEEEVVDCRGMSVFGRGHVLRGQLLPRRGGRFRLCAAASYLLCPAGSEADLHQL